MKQLTHNNLKVTYPTLLEQKEIDYLHVLISQYLKDFKLKVQVEQFIEFFREEVDYKLFINKKKGKVTKLILNNSVVNYDIITKDFISHVLHPSGSSYIPFKLNFQTKNQFFDRIEAARNKRISVFSRTSFFSSLYAVIRGAFVFHYKRRQQGIVQLNQGRLARILNSRNKRMASLLQLRNLASANRTAVSAFQVRRTIRGKEYFWIQRKIKLGLINNRNRYRYKKLLKNEFEIPYRRYRRFARKMASVNNRRRVFLMIRNTVSFSMVWSRRSLPYRRNKKGLLLFRLYIIRKRLRKVRAQLRRFRRQERNWIRAFNVPHIRKIKFHFNKPDRSYGEVLARKRSRYLRLFISSVNKLKKVRKVKRRKINIKQNMYRK